MFKRTLSIILSIIMAVSVLPVVSFASPKVDYPVVEPVVDTYIRNNGNNTYTNFSEDERMVIHGVEGHKDNDRISFLEFDLSKYSEYVENARKITFVITGHWDAGDEESDFRFVVIPLTGKFKDINLSTLTYADAVGIKDGGVSLIEYGDDLIKNGSLTEYPARELTSTYIDLTEYCKSQVDGKIMIMLKSTNGGYSLLPMEDGGLGQRPSLIIEGDYTDTQNSVFEAAQELCRLFDGKSITSDVSLPQSFGGHSVQWESHNSEHISSDGTVVQRPLCNEPLEKCKFTFTVSSGIFNKITEKREITINLLNESEVLSESSVASDGVWHDFSSFVGEHEKSVLLKLPLSNYKKGSQISIHQNGELICTHEYDGIKTELIADVTSYCDAIASAPFVVTGELLADTAPDSAIISQVSSDGAEAVFELWNYDYGDLDYVTSDIPLPSELNGRSISWTSSERDVVANTGRIERKFSQDRTSHLTATICGEDIGFEMGFNATVIRANTSIPNGKYPQLSDPMYMSDEAFFGKWDADNGRWEIESVLRYDIYPELWAVESSAMEGDYETAKSELVAYYRTKDGESIYTFEPSGNSLQAEAAFDYIWGYYDVESLQGQGFVGTKLDWYTIDLSARGKISSGAFGLIDADMDGSSLEIYSKENDPSLSAFISVTEDGVTYKYPVVADTYISACDNKNTNYGSENYLYCREESQTERLPFSSDTKRPYFRFKIDKSFSKPTSITLNFYGRATGDKPKKVYATKCSNFASFDENVLTWHTNGDITNTIEIFNYRQTGFIFEKMNHWLNNWQVESTWGGYGTRGYQASWLMSAALGNGNEDYIYRALEIAIEQYTQQPGYRYIQALDAGWRMENIIRLIYTAINSEHMTDDVFTALMKWIYAHYDGFNGVAYTNAAANQANAVLANIARVCAYFPEFIGDGEWEKAKNDLINFYCKEEKGLFNPDGSYAESCTNYITGVMEEIAGVVRIVKARDGVNHPDYEIFAKKLLDLVTYYSTLGYSSGSTVPYGDGGRLSTLAVIEQYNEEFFDRDDLRFIASLGKEGIEPSYTSKLYPQKAICMMRSGWNSDSICAFINNDNGGTHGHKDELAVDVWAYGSQLLVDAGVSSYSPGVDFTSLREKTELHNTIVIDGKDQSHATYNSAGPTELKSNKAFDFVHASTDKAYTGFDMHRKVLLLKNKYIIVSDRVINNSDSDTHSYTLYWHPDYNRNLMYDSQTGVVQTTHSSSPNIKIIVPDKDTEPQIHTRWMNAPVLGVAQSESVKYTKESADSTTFDTVLYPQDTDVDDDVRVTRLPLSSASDVATALKININANTGYYYSSNEENPSERTFDSYTFDGEMAYVEKDYANKVSYIAFSKASEISDGGKKLVYSENKLNDFSAIFESATLKLYGSETLSDGIMIATDKEYGNVTYNDEAIDFSYSNGYIITGNAGVSDTPDSGINSGTPSSPNRGESSSSGGGAGTSVVTPTAPQTTVFEDCKGHWAESYIVSLFEKGIVAGKTATEFSPDTFVTRAEFAKLIAGALGLELPQEHTAVFKDVSQSDWYSPYVNAVFAAGIISGYEDGTFKPNKLVTRQEMAKMLCVAAELKQLNADGSSAEFADFAMVDSWAAEYVLKSSAFGLFGGDDKNFFNPHSTATRAESSAVIHRLIGTVN